MSHRENQKHFLFCSWPTHLLLDSRLLKIKVTFRNKKEFYGLMSRVYLSSSKSFLSTSSFENQLCSGALMDHGLKALILNMYDVTSISSKEHS